MPWAMRKCTLKTRDLRQHLSSLGRQVIQATNRRESVLVLFLGYPEGQLAANLAPLFNTF